MRHALRQSTDDLTWTETSRVYVSLIHCDRTWTETLFPVDFDLMLVWFQTSCCPESRSHPPLNLDLILPTLTCVQTPGQDPMLPKNSAPMFPCMGRILPWTKVTSSLGPGPHPALGPEYMLP